FTAVVPSGNVAPDAGEHVVLTGGAPSVTVGAVYVTVCDGVVTLVTLTSAGQAICGGLAVGAGGGGAFEPHAATTTRAVARAARVTAGRRTPSACGGSFSGSPRRT